MVSDHATGLRSGARAFDWVKKDSLERGIRSQVLSGPRRQGLKLGLGVRWSTDNLLQITNPRNKRKKKTTPLLSRFFTTLMMTETRQTKRSREGAKRAALR